MDIRRACDVNTGASITSTKSAPAWRPFFLHYGDTADSTNLIKLLYRIQPEEVYHLAAQSHVRVSFDIPEYTADVTGLSTIRILEAIRETGVKSKFYQASSSEMFGKATEVPQRESTPFYPRSPYGAAKVYAHWVTVNYRESYDLFACCGILFITKVHAGARLSLRGKSRAQFTLYQSRLAGENSTWETWRPNAIGVMPGSMWRRCLCSNKTNQDDFVIATVRRIQLQSF